MDKAALLQKLKQEIKEEEISMLSENRDLHISQYNRRTLLDMLSLDSAPEGEVSEKRVEALYHTLVSYLGVYMADAEDAWKWIILTCIYLGFICEQPLHPQEVVHYITKTEGQQPSYFCPMKEESVGSVCLFCVCKRMR